jgi:cytochrome c6
MILVGLIIWLSSSTASWAAAFPIGADMPAVSQNTSQSVGQNTSPIAPQSNLQNNPQNNSQSELPLSPERLGAVPLTPIESKTLGKQVFSNNCSACHVGGGNVLIAEKTLMKEALEKYGMESLAAIQTQVTHGKNAMPSFAKRLSGAEIDAVAGYVLTQAEAGW